MFDDAWRYVDAFRVDQAAALWVGENPAGFAHRYADDEIQNRIAARKQMLVGGIASGKLHADHSTNGLSIIGDYDSSIVTRDELIRYARAKGLFPAFLFDTIAPEPEVQEVAEDQHPKKKRGRPVEYDWDLMYAEIVRLSVNGDLPNTQAQLVQDLLFWFTIDPDDETIERKAPAQRLVEERVKTIYNNFKRLGWTPARNPTKSKP